MPPRLQALECKVPPPALALGIAAAMWVTSLLDSAPAVPVSIRAVLAVAIAIGGGVVGALGVTALRRAWTTSNAMRPQFATSLVTSGVYRFSRNPMYLGRLIGLLAWSFFLFSPWALWGPLIFILYVGRFQIVPEERALLARFGDRYRAYKTKVRRWL